MFREGIEVPRKEIDENDQVQGVGTRRELGDG